MELKKEEDIYNIIIEMISGILVSYEMFEIYLQPEKKFMGAIGANVMIFVTYKIRNL